MTLTPEQKAAGWIEWSGGECPIKDDRTSFAFFNRLGGCAAEGGNARSLDWSHKDSSWDIIAYRIIEAHGADAEPARPTPYPNSMDDLVYDADGLSQPFITGGVWPEWLPDDALWQAQSVGDLWASKGWFTGELAIRVRRREPKRETVRISVEDRIAAPRFQLFGTIDLIDGKPDLSTLKIAEGAL